MEQTESRNAGFQIIKAAVTAVIISLVAILLTAFLIKLFNIATDAIPVINQIIKGISILTGCLIAFKGGTNGWLRGIAAGLLYIIAAFVIFSLLDGSFNMDLSLLNDAALGAVSGMVSGILALMIKSGRK